MMKNIRPIVIISLLVVVIGFGIVSVMKNINMNPRLLQSVKIEIGMPRADAEQLIAHALKTESKYNVYEGSIATGDQTARYSDGIGTLEIVYNQGTPAPLVQNSQGDPEHYSPIDQTVKSFRYLSN